MRKLNILIWFFGYDVEHLYKTFIILHLNHNIEKSNINTIIAKCSVPSQETDLNTISFEDIHKSSFDYIIITGIYPPPPPDSQLYVFEENFCRKN